MPRTEDANQRIREEQRANILDGARSAFARKGKATTMADVAEAAGVSQGLAYRYFANKEEILRELVEQAIQAALTAFQPVQEVSATPGERLTLLITGMVESRRDHLETFQLLDQILTSDATQDDYRELVEKRGQDFLDLLRQLIVEGQATGEVVAGDPDGLVTAIAASLEGLVKFALRHPEQFSKAYPDADIFLRMLKP
jgi:AcrR family transcriptional regulator